MIPSVACDPKINVIYIGGKILLNLKECHMSVDELLNDISQELDVSIDHVILSLDWLFTISAIKLNGNQVLISETKNS